MRPPILLAALLGVPASDAFLCPSAAMAGLPGTKQRSQQLQFSRYVAADCHVCWSGSRHLLDFKSEMHSCKKGEKVKSPPFVHFCVLNIVFFCLDYIRECSHHSSVFVFVLVECIYLQYKYSCSLCCMSLIILEYNSSSSASLSLVACLL